MGVHRNGVRKRSRVDIALSTLDDDEFVFMMAMVMDYGNEVRYRDGYRYVALEKKNCGGLGFRVWSALCLFSRLFRHVT